MQLAPFADSSLSRDEIGLGSFSAFTLAHMLLSGKHSLRYKLLNWGPFKINNKKPPRAGWMWAGRMAWSSVVVMYSRHLDCVAVSHTPVSSHRRGVQNSDLSNDDHRELVFVMFGHCRTVSPMLLGSIQCLVPECQLQYTSIWRRWVLRTWSYSFNIMVPGLRWNPELEIRFRDSVVILDVTCCWNGWWMLGQWLCTLWYIYFSIPHRDHIHKRNNPPHRWTSDILLLSSNMDTNELLQQMQWYYMSYDMLFLDPIVRLLGLYRARKWKAMQREGYPII